MTPGSAARWARGITVPYHENRKASVRFSWSGERRLLEGSLGHLHAPLPFAAARIPRDRRRAALLARRRVLAETVTTFPPRQTTTGTSARSCKARASRA